MAEGEEPLKVKPPMTELEILVEAHNAALEKKCQELVGGPEDDGRDEVMGFYTNLFHFFLRPPACRYNRR